MTNDWRFTYMKNPRVRLQSHWDFFEAVSDAHRRDARKLLAILRDGGDNGRTFTRLQLDALADLIYRQIDRHSDERGHLIGRKGDTALYGTKAHARETVYFRAKADIEALSAKRDTSTHSGATTREEKMDILIKHKQLLIDSMWPHAESVDLDILLRRWHPKRRARLAGA